MFERPNKKNGFSIIEALVAIAILALGLLAVLGVFPLTLQVNKEGERLSLASVYARAKLEQVSELSYDDVTAGVFETRAKLSNDSADPAYYLERQTIVSYVNSDLQTSVSDTGFKKIEVTVFWTNQHGQDSFYILTTLLANK